MALRDIWPNKGAAPNYDAYMEFSDTVEAELSLLGEGVGAPTDAGMAAVLASGGEFADEVSAKNAELRPDGVTYNGDGTIATSTEGGITTTYTWNSDGTIATEARLGKTKTYVYDGSGRLTGSVVV